MCGIAGVRRYGDNPINPAEVKTLLCSLEYRGNHATGIACMTEEGIKIHKSPTPAWDFIATKETNEFLDAWLPNASMVLLHTRYATVGDPADNDNNHPFYAGESAIVHNGGISNHTWMFENLKLDRYAETDSDIFRAILDSQGVTPEALTTMNRLSGSAAIAAFSESEPDKLILARSGSPLHIGTAADKLWWASTEDAIHRAVRPWVQHHGIWARKTRSDIAYNTMPDDSAYILTGKGLDHRQPFKVCLNYSPPPYVANRNYAASTYASKQRNFQTERERKERISRFRAGPSTTVRMPAAGVTAEVTNQNRYTHKVAPCRSCNTACYIPRGDEFTAYSCHKCSKTLAGINVSDIKLCKDPEKKG